MAVVREKGTEGSILSNQEPKKICNRVCSEWRCKHDESRLETAGAVHPTVATCQVQVVQNLCYHLIQVK